VGPSRTRADCGGYITRRIPYGKVKISPEIWRKKYWIEVKIMTPPFPAISRPPTSTLGQKVLGLAHAAEAHSKNMDL
jgi:hypothetical protein